jgi:hypothetical protein
VGRRPSLRCCGTRNGGASFRFAPVSGGRGPADVRGARAGRPAASARRPCRGRGGDPRPAAPPGPELCRGPARRGSWWPPPCTVSCSPGAMGALLVNRERFRRTEESLSTGPGGVGPLTRVTFHPSYSYEDSGATPPSCPTSSWNRPTPTVAAPSPFDAKYKLYDEGKVDPAESTRRSSTPTRMRASSTRNSTRSVR